MNYIMSFGGRAVRDAITHRIWTVQEGVKEGSINEPLGYSDSFICKTGKTTWGSQRLVSSGSRYRFL